MLEVGSEAPTDSVALFFKKYVIMMEVKVKRKSGEIVKFMVDDADYLSVIDYKWYFRENRFIALAKRI